MLRLVKVGKAFAGKMYPESTFTKPIELSLIHIASVSMLGEPWRSPLKPLMKNFWLMTMTMPASSSCTRCV